MGLFGKKQSADATSARERDKLRESEENKKKKQKKEKVKKKIKRTVMDTLPYECFVSNHVMLLKSGVKVAKQTMNLYSKSYFVPDINYSALTEEEQGKIMSTFVDLLNGFDSTASLQITMVNSPMNNDEFTERLIIPPKEDGLNDIRAEFNEIMREKVVERQKGLQCRRYFTITVAAVDLETANSKFFNLESHLMNHLKLLGTEPMSLNANDRVRIMTDLLRDVNQDIEPCSRTDFARQTEKELCAPDYFEFKRDYFMFNQKYARCLFLRKIPAVKMKDTLFKNLLETNLPLTITENIEFIETDVAVRMLRRKQTDMKQEAMNKTKYASNASKGAFVDPIEGTQLSLDMEETAEFLDNLQKNNHKMTFCQWIIMLTADTFEELKKNTETIRTILRTYQIDSLSAPNEQEIAFDSVFPVGNSNSCDTDNNLQVRRTMSSESTALFMPFNACELMHKNGLWYGINPLSNSMIKVDRSILPNPNGFIFGIPGSGKSMTAKIEILSSALTTDDDIIILDPDGEYTKLAELLGAEVIYISENSGTHINPLDLTENPDADDKEYDPLKAKLDFLLSFFSCILGDKEISPIQKTVIDNVMLETYKKYSKPTLKEYFEELKLYEGTADEEIKKDVVYLRQTLELYVTGSMNLFAHESNVNINNRIVVYNVKQLGDNLLTLGMVVTMENIWNRLAQNRTRQIGTRLYVDEMYLFFKSETSAEFFYKLYKRARKWGGIPTGITQNVDDVLRSAQARTMISNTKFVVMLEQNSTDSQQLADLLDIAPETMRYVENPQKGTGLIYAGAYGTIPFDGRIPTNSKIYSSITTQFKENLTTQS